MSRLRKTAVLEGTVQQGFEDVREACLQNIFKGREAGVQLCCFHKGKMVVNLSGGSSPQERMWPNSLMMVFSSSKVMESLVIAMLVDRGHLAYSDSLKKIWPELNVDDAVTVRDLMRHQAGLLPSVSLDEISDPDALAKAIQSEPPFWNSYDLNGKAHDFKPSLKYDGFEPFHHQGCTKRQGYHAISRGWYASELCRRSDPKGRTLSKFFEEEVAAVLRAQDKSHGDFFIGCPESEQARCAKATKDPVVKTLLKVVAHALLPRWLVKMLYSKFDLLYRYEINLIKGVIFSKMSKKALVTAVKGVSGGAVAYANDPKFRSTEMASVTGCGSATAMAAILSKVACSEKNKESTQWPLSSEGLKEALETDEILIDEVLQRPVTYTNCGWSTDRFEFVGAKGWIGWGGMGGSVLVFNPTTGSAFAYVPTKLSTRLFKPRGVACLMAFIDCIEKVEGKR